MAKVKRFLTELEDMILSELRELEDGSITQETVDTVVGTVRGQRSINTAFYNRSSQSIDEFMSENFGCRADGELGEEPSQAFLIDFN